MKKLTFSWFLIFTIVKISAQPVRGLSDIQKIIKKAETNSHLKVFTGAFNSCDGLCKLHPLLLFSYFEDSISHKLEKAEITDLSDLSFRTYFFRNDRLVLVRECFDVPNSVSSTHFFMDALLSIGTTYVGGDKGEVYLKRQKMLADAYLVLLHFDSIASKEVTQTN